MSTKAFIIYVHIGRDFHHFARPRRVRLQLIFRDHLADALSFDFFGDFPVELSWAPTSDSQLRGRVMSCTSPR